MSDKAREAAARAIDRLLSPEAAQYVNVSILADAAIDAYIAARRAEGFVEVPVEPTEEMLRAAYPPGEEITNPDALRWTAQSYRAMLNAASPPHPAK